MKCLCCEKVLSDTAYVCPRCGFPIVYMADSTQIPQDMMQEEIKKYRLEKVRGLCIQVARYYWKKQGEEIVLDHKAFFELCRPETLIQESGSCLPEDRFCRTVSADTIELEYKLSENGPIHKTVIPVPKDESFWRLGVEMEPGVSFHFVLKSDGQSTCSPSISLL